MILGAGRRGPALYQLSLNLTYQLVSSFISLSLSELICKMGISTCLIRDVLRIREKVCKEAETENVGYYVFIWGQEQYFNE